jgi:hypothetical protein
MIKKKEALSVSEFGSDGWWLKPSLSRFLVQMGNMDVLQDSQ